MAAFTTVGALVLSFGVALPAQAAQTDYAPGPNDIVGVGSDTLQYIMDFADDGDFSGDAGFNTAGGAYKVVSFDATADSNARAAYLNNSSDTTLLPLDPTDVLRAGTFPVQRINGSGAGISALIANQGTSGVSSLPFIDFVRMSTQPSSAQAGDFYNASTCTGSTPTNCGIIVDKIASENLAIVKDSVASNYSSTTSVALSAKELYAIYSANVPDCPTWASEGITGGTADTDWIAPLIPQSGSGTRNTFLSDIEAAAGETSITLGSCVTTVEENDPTGVTGFVTPSTWTADPVGAGVADSQDAIVPFSGSRLNLWNGVSGDPTLSASSGVGYFHNPTLVYGTTPNPSEVPDVVQVTTGTGTDGNPAYVDNRALNIVFPATDLNSTLSGEPGSPYNWANLLFCQSSKSGAPTPWMDTPAGEVDIAQAGADPSGAACPAPMT